MKGGGAMPKAGPWPQVKALREKIKFLKVHREGIFPIDADVGQFGGRLANIQPRFVSRPKAKET